MAQKAATVVIENVVTELLREWQSQFHDLQFWWRPETSTTYVLYLVSEQFEDIFAEELQGLRDELQFALEAETDCFWKVIMLTPKDVKKIQADLKKDLEQLAERLREHAHAFGQLANRVPAAEVTFEEREWQDWLAQADRLASCLKEDAKRFYERFLLYRGWDNLWVKAVHTVSELMKLSAQHIKQITQALKSQLQRESLLKGELSEIVSKLRLMQDALLKVSEAISGEKPDARMLQQMSRWLKLRGG
jgi:DNA-directed RNA polymerase subunit F